MDVKSLPVQGLNIVMILYRADVYIADCWPDTMGTCLLDDGNHCRIEDYLPLSISRVSVNSCVYPHYPGQHSAEKLKHSSAKVA